MVIRANSWWLLFNTFERELAVFVKSYPFIYTLREYISPSERLFFSLLATTHKNKERAYTGFILAPCGSLDFSLLEVEIRIVFKLLLPFKLHSISEIYFIWHTKTSPGEWSPNVPKFVARSMKYPLLASILCLTQLYSLWFKSWERVQRNWLKNGQSRGQRDG